MSSPPTPAIPPEVPPAPEGGTAAAAAPARPPADSPEERRAWAASGAMSLTGRPDGPPLGPPPGFVGRLRAVGDALTRHSETLGRRVEVDVLALLGERAALAGLRRRGAVSCGGAARLLRCADGWLAVNLPRPDDVELLPAWLAGLPFDPAVLGAPGPGPAAAGDPERITHRHGGQTAPAPAAGAGTAPGVWAAIATVVARASADALVERAGWLGLPVAALPSHPPGPLPPPTPHTGKAASSPHARRVPWSGADPGRLPALATAFGGSGPPPAPLSTLDGALVVDLSSLWAGPLCTHLLQAAGARVVKVESVHRPDGARSGPAAFFDLLHAGQESVALDFRTEAGRAALRRLIEAADVIVEASRPRALEQLGIHAESLLSGDRPRPTSGSPENHRPGRAGGRCGGPQVWVSITGYGRRAAGPDRVAFGDDAAVAGGLVAWDRSAGAGGLVAGEGAGPCFLADAVADPCAGLVAAAATLAALTAGGRWLLDVSMRDVATHLAGPITGPQPVPPFAAAPPRARTAPVPAAPFGRHTAAVLAEFPPPASSARR